jgi:hypothetical protein
VDRTRAGKSLRLVLLCAAVYLLAGAPLARRGVRTWRFTARIRSNDGLTPFETGGFITGTFTIDLDAAPEMQRSVPGQDVFRSKSNAITFTHEGFQFVGKDVDAVVTATEVYESFEVVARDGDLSAGWGKAPAHAIRGRETSYLEFGFRLLHTSPHMSRVLRRDGSLPGRLSLKDFTLRDVRLYFPNGTTFPGGKLTKRGVTVVARVESLTLEK